MRVLILAPSFWPATKAGGPARSLTNLAREAATSHEVTVVTADRDLGDDEPFTVVTSSDFATVAGARVLYVNVRSIRAIWQAYSRITGAPYDLIVINSVWHRTLSLLPAVAIVSGRIRAQRVVLMARGELEAGALALKSGRKRLAAGFAKRLYGRAVDVVAATSDSEERNLREWFPSHPCLRVSNSPDEVQAGFVPPESDHLRVLFIGRIHPTKGLLELVRAVAASEQPIRLTIAGPVGDQVYWESCKDLIDQLPGEVEVDVRGSVDRDTIPGLLWSHDLMVTLTLGENFGHTIAESLQAGCPVLATDATPWTPYLTEGGGFVVSSQADVEAAASLLKRAAQMLPEERLAMRSTAQKSYQEWRMTQAPNVISAALRLGETSPGERPGGATPQRISARRNQRVGNR